MLTDDKWRAISASRQPRQRVVSLGDVARQQFERCTRGTGARLDAVRDCLRGVVGPDFQAHCRIASLYNGRLTIAVDEPARLDMLRRAYLFVLVERLAVLAPDILVTDVHWTVFRERTHGGSR